MLVPAVTRNQRNWSDLGAPSTSNVTFDRYTSGMANTIDPRASGRDLPRSDHVYLAEVAPNGDFLRLYLLAGRFGSRGGYQLTDRGWVADDLPIDWLVGSADHLDPVVGRWARRWAHQIGVDDPTFDRPTRPR